MQHMRLNPAYIDVNLVESAQRGRALPKGYRRPEAINVATD